MMKRVLSLLVCLLLVTGLFAGCGNSAPSQSSAAADAPAADATEPAVGEDTQAPAGDTAAPVGAPVTLKLAVESAVGTPGEVSGGDFQRLVAEKSGGAITIEYYPVGQLGTGDDLTEQMLGGSVDMSWRAIEWYSKLEKGWQILGMGFLFKDEPHLLAFLDSDKHAEFKENLVQTSGLRVIADKGIGAPRVLVSKKPVNGPDDMKGMNMRVPGLEMSLKTWQGVGVNIMEIPWGDSYMALSQGTADALESPLGSIYGMKFHEVAKNITYTNHMYSPYVMAINEQSYQKLSPEQQAVLTECAEEAAALYTTYDAEAVAENKATMESEGVAFNETPDIDAFMTQLADVAKQCEADGMWPQGLYDYVQGLKQ